MKDELSSLRSELSLKSRRLESALAESARLKARLQGHVGDSRGEEERARAAGELSAMTGKCEYLESELRNAEDRFQSTLGELEKQTIVCKDRDKKIHLLMEEVGTLKVVVKFLHWLLYLFPVSSLRQRTRTSATSVQNVKASGPSCPRGSPSTTSSTRSSYRAQYTSSRRHSSKGIHRLYCTDRVVVRYVLLQCSLLASCC